MTHEHSRWGARRRLIPSAISTSQPHHPLHKIRNKINLFSPPPIGCLEEEHVAEVCASGLEQMETSVGCDVRLNNVSENEKGGESSDVV